MNFIELEQPKLKRPRFLCDEPLHSKLNAHPISALMNKHSCVAAIGPPGSGKSHHLLSLIATDCLFKGVFESIFLFMPPNSRASIKNSPFNNLPDGQIFDDVSAQSLLSVYKQAETNSKEGFRTLILFDDVQRYLREKGTEKQLLHMMNNRRHAKLTVWFAVQNYKSLTPSMRNGLTSLFVFKISKREMENIFNDLIDTHKDKFSKLIDDVLFRNPHDFLFVDLNSQRLFNNWTQEITFD